MSSTYNFLRERRAALLSMDKSVIKQFADKWGAHISAANDEVFWVAVHKARTMATDLPMAARSTSKRWLLERGYRPLDDGDVPE